jgi:hypothetical protein
MVGLCVLVAVANPAAAMPIPSGSHIYVYRIEATGL